MISEKMETQTITAIVLAAGLGSRFGGDKLLASIRHPNKTDSKQALGLISALNVKPHVDDVLCIVKPQDKALKELLHMNGLRTVDNHDYEKGLSSSIQTGIQALSHSQSHYMICLADMPYISAETYEALTDTFRCDIQNLSDLIVRPVMSANNQAGHPVIFSHSHQQSLQALTGDDGGKPIIKRQGFTPVQVSDTGILADIDVKQDIRS